MMLSPEVVAELTKFIDSQSALNEMHNKLFDRVRENLDLVDKISKTRAETCELRFNILETQIKILETKLKMGWTVLGIFIALQIIFNITLM